MRRTAAVLVFLTAVSCDTRTVDLDGRPCDSNDECLPGYTCDLSICVPVGTGHCELGRLQTCGTCEQDCSIDVENAAAVCRAVSTEEYDCDYEGTCSPGFGDADLDRSNGCECVESGAEVCDNVDNDCNGDTDDGLLSCQCTTLLPSAERCDRIDNDCNQDIDDVFPCSGVDIRDCTFAGDPAGGSELCNGVACNWSGNCVEKDFDPPGQVTVTATAGDGSVALAWTYPIDTDLSQCVIRRKVDTAPTGRDDGDLVREINGPGPGDPGLHTDPNVSNGTLYHYGVYCRDTSGNWQSLATTDSALPAAPAPNNPDNLAAAAGDGQVNLTFDTPNRFSACLLVRKVDAAPANHTDDTTLGTFTPPAATETFQDITVSNGVTYFYAVFCHTDETWNDIAIADENLVSAVPHSPNDCLPGDTVTGSVMPIFCRHFTSTQSNGLLMGIVLNTNCANTLTGLTVRQHPASTVVTELSNFRLFLDTNSSGDLEGGTDALLAIGSVSGTTVTFTLSTALPAATDVGFLLVADIGTVDVPLFTAWQVGASDIALDDPDPIVSLAGGSLTSPAHTLSTSGRCSGGDDASDLGPGTFGAISVQAIEGPGNTSSWASGAGEEDSDWNDVGANFGNALADCQLITAGSPSAVYVTDGGNSSVLLRINTGIPLGLPLCGLDMRVYGTEYVLAGTCDRNQLSNFQDLYAFYYDSSNSVTGGTVLDITTTSGPQVGANTCNSHFADFDLSALYSDASADGDAEDPFKVRIIFEEGGGIGTDDTISTTVPELYFRISP